MLVGTVQDRVVIHMLRGMVVQLGLGNFPKRPLESFYMAPLNFFLFKFLSFAGLDFILEANELRPHVTSRHSFTSKYSIKLK